MSKYEIERVLMGMGSDAIVELEHKLRRECAWVGVSVTDIVGDSYVYVVNGVLNGSVKTPQTVTDLYRLMAAKARLLLKDARRSLTTKHGRRSIRAERSLDEIVGERETELMENGSYEQWKTRCFEEEMQHRYEIGRKVLDKVCELRKGNVVSKNIFKAVVLQQMSPQTVAVQYGTTRNNVDQIVSRVNGWLRKDGRRIFRRLYDEAA